MLFEMVTDAKFVQSENAPVKMLVTLLGIVMDVKFVQPIKTCQQDLLHYSELWQMLNLCNQKMRTL